MCAPLWDNCCNVVFKIITTSLVSLCGVSQSSSLKPFLVLETGFMEAHSSKEGREDGL